MTPKLPFKTGTVDTITSDGRRAYWVPKGDLTLIVSEAALDQYESSLPNRVQSNPDAAAMRRMIEQSGEARTGIVLLDRFLDWSFGKKRAFPAIKDTARLFIGHNIGDQPVWRSGEIYLLAYLLRSAQLARKRRNAQPAFSFYSGMGAFPGQGGAVATEQSSTLFFMNFGQGSDKFFDDMVELAKDLGEALRQESILTELSENGKVFLTEYIDIKRSAWHSESSTRKFIESHADRIPKHIFERE